MRTKFNFRSDKGLILVPITLMLVFQSCKKKEFLEPKANAISSVQMTNELSLGSMDNFCSFVEPANNGAEGAVRKACVWPNGSTIKVKFLNGENYSLGGILLTDMVKQGAREWEEYANIRFQFVANNQNADIKVSFYYGAGGNSALGTACKVIAQNIPSFNIGIASSVNTTNNTFIPLPNNVILTTIRHELGHTLGMVHEHQSPGSPIIWNQSYVLSQTALAPNFWDAATTQANIFNKEFTSQTNYTSFDPNSIMLYSFPGNWTTNYPVGTKYNTQLSITDKRFIAAMYPFPDNASLKSTLVGGEQLTVGEVIYSPNGRYKAQFYSDGALKLRFLNRSNTIGDELWRTNSLGMGGVRAYFMSVGRLNIYNSSGSVVWHSTIPSTTNGGGILTLQNDGNLVIKKQGSVIWQSGTGISYN